MLLFKVPLSHILTYSCLTFSFSPLFPDYSFSKLSTYSYCQCKDPPPAPFHSSFNLFLPSHLVSSFHLPASSFSSRAIPLPTATPSEGRQASILGPSCMICKPPLHLPSLSTLPSPLLPRLSELDLTCLYLAGSGGLTN